jgi:hypothetical protein
MNDDRRPTDWPDDRLAGAFRSRADAHPTPSDLAAPTIDRIRRAPRIAPTRDRFVRLGGIVATAAVVAIAAVALLARPTGGPISSPGPTTFGLPILSVSEALAIRDGGVDDREIAIHGFLSERIVVACPFVARPPNPTELRCPEAFAWLMSAPESIVLRNGNSVTVHGPTGPALNPGLALVDTTGVISDSDVATPVVFIGHFDDRRADFCPADVRPTCADTFIVDRIDRGTLATVTVKDLAQPDQPVRADSEIDALIRRVDPSLRILSRRVVAVERLASTEPVYQATPSGTPSYVSKAAWVVTALPPLDAGGRAVARTFVIFDGTDLVSEITRNGPIHVTLGDAASPSPGTTSTSMPNPSLGPTTSPTPSQSAQATLSTLLAAPITVSQAIDHRDNHLDDSELAVSGYWIDHSGQLRCAYAVHRSPVELGCQWRWLTEVPPVDWTNSSEPDQPALAPILAARAFVDPAIADGITTGVSVIALGHFDDPRAGQCDPYRVESCRRNFIVDAIVDPARTWPAGTASAPGLSCAGLPIADCAAAAIAVLGSISTDQGFPTAIEIGAGIWCPTPGLLFADTSCPAGGLPPAEGGQWIGYALVTFADTSAQAYLNIARSGLVVHATAVAMATPPPSLVVHVEDTEHVLIGTRSLTITESARLDWSRIVDPAGTASAEIAEVPGRAGDIAVRWMAPACQPSLRVFGHGNGLIQGEVAVLPVLPIAGCPGPDHEWDVVVEFRDPIRASLVEILSLSGG